MRILRSLDDQFWLDVAAKSAHATFFHTPLWRTLIVQALPEYRDATVAAMLDEGTRVVLPMLETGRSGRGLLRHTISTFGGCYGGLIADAPLSSARHAEVLTALLLRRRVGSLEMTESPLDCALQLPAPFASSPYSTHMVPLEESSDAVESRFSRGNLGNIRRGRRLGVTSRVATSLDSYRDYYRIYEKSLERWGDQATSRYPWALFEAGQEIGMRFPDNMKLWLAEVDGTVVAGAWVFYWNRHVVYWHGATDVAASTHRPANVLHADIIQDACARGYGHYDFNPSGGHEGVARFKSGFGGAPTPLQVWSYQSAAMKALRSVRRYIP